MGKLAVVSFGRMAPVTVGHRRLAIKMKALSDAHNGTALLYLSKKYDGKADRVYKRKPTKPLVPSNPLKYEDKVRFASDAFGDIIPITSSEHTKLFDILAEVNQRGYTDIMILGDEVFLSSPFEKYNGRLYNFDTITKLLSGIRRDSSEDFLETVSATRARLAALENDFETFESIVATKKTTRELWSILRRELLGND